MGEFKNTFDLSEKEGGPRSCSALQSPSMTGFKAVLFPIAFPLVVKPDVRKRMKMLKAVVETNSASLMRSSRSLGSERRSEWP